MLYRSLIRPVLFSIDAETTHQMFLSIGSMLGKSFLTRAIISYACRYENKKLETEIAGMKLKNPVGLSAGFDKNAVLTDIIPAVGFGFMEVGSITALPCRGNPKPRVFRLTEDNAIAVNYGLCNDGSRAIAERLKGKKCAIPLGISIAKTNNPAIRGRLAIEDYYQSFQALQDAGDYITLNISCPNAGDGRTFEDAVLLGQLLKRIHNTDKRVFLKISADLGKEGIDAVLKTVKGFHISGFIVSNLTKDRGMLKTSEEELKGIRGGISGMPLRKKSTALIQYIRKKSHEKYALIGVGGIFSADDAYEKIRAGASAVQLITGMIYEGPLLIKKINKGIVQLLEKDGFRNITEAVGSEI